MGYLALFLVSLNFHSALGESDEGYITDIYCWEKPNHRAIDGANMQTNPERHSIHCLIDISACINSGYGLLVNQGTAESPDYYLKYTFDAAGNTKTFDWLTAIRPSHDPRDVFVRANGTMGANNIFVLDALEIPGANPVTPPVEPDCVLADADSPPACALAVCSEEVDAAMEEKSGCAEATAVQACVAGLNTTCTADVTAGLATYLQCEYDALCGSSSGASLFAGASTTFLGLLALF